MASTTSSIIAQDSNQQLIAINVSAQAPLKLNATNYLSWKLRFNTLFIGYDLIDFIDCSKPCLTPTIAIDSKTINQAYTQWERKHQLIFNVLENSGSRPSFHSGHSGSPHPLRPVTTDPPCSRPMVSVLFAMIDHTLVDANSRILEGTLLNCAHPFA
ncbi:hypothetical protein CK203_091409 [Vitis vinifera]|uniref:Retrovirus-related Pol polyprotein from transposon RE1 n=1 Tax=Vitis vinifera TaxID=29760 RepID=A0A438CLZ4_VITVI|nr:hypothetical protein CK203_091409 [Vitis vinifera]